MSQVSQRRSASGEEVNAAADNVRRCRALARQQNQRRAEARNRQAMGISLKGEFSQAWAERQRKDRELAARLCAKHFRDPRDPERLELPTPIVLLYDYWMARACGWDVLVAEYSRDRDHRPCQPSDSYTWVWWEGLHYKQRRQVRAEIKTRLRAAKMK